MLQAFKSLHLTFYSVPFYRDLLRSWKGFGLGFIFAAVLLNLALAAFALSGPFMNFLKERDALFESFPTVSIKDGQLSIDAPSPLEIKLLEGNKGGPVRIIFDMALEKLSLDEANKKMSEANIFALATKEQILFHDQVRQQTEELLLSDFNETEITHEKWKEISDSIVPVFLPLFAVSSGFFLFLSHLGTAFCGAALLFLLSPLLKIEASFSGVFRLAAAAKVPVAVFLAFTPEFPLARLLVWGGFALFGLLASRKKASE